MPGFARQPFDQLDLRPQPDDPPDGLGHPGTRRLYGDKLVTQGALQVGEPDEMVKSYRAAMDALDHAVILAKAALRLLGLPAGPVRSPLVDATEDQITALKADLAAGGVHV